MKPRSLKWQPLCNTTNNIILLENSEVIPNEKDIIDTLKQGLLHESEVIGSSNSDSDGSISLLLNAVSSFLIHELVSDLH